LASKNLKHNVCCTLVFIYLKFFSEYNGWDLLLALSIHLLPSIVLLGVAIISWKYDLVGAIIFFLFLFFILLRLDSIALGLGTLLYQVQLLLLPYFFLLAGFKRKNLNTKSLKSDFVSSSSQNGFEIIKENLSTARWDFLIELKYKL